MKDKKLEFISPHSIMTVLDEVVWGQVEAKKFLSTLGYIHLLKLYQHKTHSSLTIPSLHGLITGPTGWGKTSLVKELARCLGFPFLSIDANHLTLVGYSGESILQKLEYLKRNSDPHYYPYSIIFIDEIDKLGQLGASSESSDHGASLQYSLLSTVEGTSQNQYKIDTSRMLFIFAGAFSSAYEARKKANTTIGFNADITGQDFSIYDQPLTIEEIYKQGIVKELIGRFGAIFSVKPLSKEEIRTALTAVYNSVISQFSNIFSLSGVAANAVDAVLDEVVETISQSDSGFREAKRIFLQKLLPALTELKGISEDHWKIVEEKCDNFLDPILEDETIETLDDTSLEE